MANPLPADYAEAVLALVDQIPPGKVLSYGDVAELLEAGGPRSVGRVLSIHGGRTSWWRVVRTSGEPAPEVAGRALERYAVEGTPLRRGRVVMAVARWAGPGGGGGPVGGA